MANSSSSCGLLSSTSSISTHSPALQHFSPDFDAITKRIPDFSEKFKLPNFQQLMSRVDGHMEEGKTDRLVNESPDSAPLPNDKFGSLVPSPILYREKLKEGAANGGVDNLGITNTSMATKDGAKVTQEESLVLPNSSMAALENVLDTNTEGTLLCSTQDHEGFPVLSRDSLGNVKTSSKRSGNMQMAAAKGAKPRVPTIPNNKETRKAESKGVNNGTFLLKGGSEKEKNQVDNLPSKAYLGKWKVAAPTKTRPPWADFIPLTRDINEEVIKDENMVDGSKIKKEEDSIPSNKVVTDLVNAPFVLADLPHTTIPIIKEATTQLTNSSNVTSNATKSYSNDQDTDHIVIGDIKVQTQGAKNNSYSFEDSKRTTLRYIAPEIVNGNVFVRPTWEIAQKGRRRWDHTAVGYFLGKKLSFMGVKNYAFSVWQGLKDVKATSSGFYFFTFESESTLMHVLEGGPWMYSGQPLFLERWKEGMSLEHKSHHEVPIWVKFRHLPVEYWTRDGLSMVASSIGKPLYPDAYTLSMERIDYARVCVLVSVGAKFHDHIYMMLPSETGEYNGTCKVGVEYEWRPIRCKKCQLFGHLDVDCPSSKKDTQRDKPVHVYIPKPTRDVEWQQQKKKGGSGSSRSTNEVTAQEMPHRVEINDTNLGGSVTRMPPLVPKPIHRRTDTKESTMAMEDNEIQEYNSFALLEYLELEGEAVRDTPLLPHRKLIIEPIDT